MQGSNGAVLIVEDDRSVAQTIGDYLRSYGFAVDYAADGRQMRECFSRFKPDVVLMDVVLPREDGWSLLKELRERHGMGSLGIIMLTIRGGINDLVHGLDNGADDYIAKPFRMPELVSRISAVMRRCSLIGHWSCATPPVWSFGEWQLDRHAWTLHNASLPAVKLTAGEFAILDELLSHAHQTIDRDTLSRRTRHRGLGDADRSIDVVISSLRQKLHDDARAPLLIKTVRGQGYQFGLDVAAKENSIS